MGERAPAGKQSAVICPTGCFVSSAVSKNISLYRLVETSLEPRAVRSLRGAYRDRHGRGVGCDGRGSVRRDNTRADEWRLPPSLKLRRTCRRGLWRRRVLRTAKPCGPDAPTLASSWRNPPLTTVARKPGHRGEHG